MLRLLLDTQAIALLIKLCYTISLRITYTITKYSSFVILLCIYYCLMKHLVQSCTIEDIIA
ncbi:unknown [Segatella copri CAG:164]|nr:unknown [Segatella copri CAG:164]